MDSLPPWPIVQSLLLTVVLPGFGSGAGLLAAVCASNRSETGRLIGAALALAGGLALGNFTRGLLPWWSLEAGWPSLLPATLVALGGGVGVALVAGRSIAGPKALVLRMIAAAGCAWWLTPTTPPSSRLGWFLLLFVGSVFHWEAFRCVALPSLRERAVVALSIPWGMSAATVLIYAASARFFDVAVLLTSTLAGVGIIAAWRKLDAAVLLAVPTIFLPALMLAGAMNTFSEVPVVSFILVALAPCALWTLRLPPLAGGSERARALAALAAITIPCAIAIALAMRAESLNFNE